MIDTREDSKRPYGERTHLGARSHFNVYTPHTSKRVTNRYGWTVGSVGSVGSVAETCPHTEWNSRTIPNQHDFDHSFIHLTPCGRFVRSFVGGSMAANGIQYSERYYDDVYEYRHVVLPPEITKKVRA